MREPTITITVTQGEIGRISFLLDNHIPGDPLQKKWDKLYIAVNSMPFDVQKIDFKRDNG